MPEPSFDCLCFLCKTSADWKCLVSNFFLDVFLDGNPVICDCKDYNIISYIRSSAPSSSWLHDVHCAAPSEFAKEKVSDSAYTGMRVSHTEN